MRRQPDHTAIDVWTRQSRTCHVITRRPSEDLRDTGMFSGTQSIALELDMAASWLPHCDS
jgi:hypothetical protein